MEKSFVCFVRVDIPLGAASAHSAELSARLTELVSQRAACDGLPEPVKNAVRDMLREGGFKPSGRQKPASEYLAQAAREGRFPFISAPVDCNNYVSLETGLPISLLDYDSIGEPAIRFGRAGERYVFNASGQEMDIEGLLCVCAAGPDGEALGNPVKDSMRGKLKETTTRLAGFIYAPLALYTADSALALGQRFCDMLCLYCGGVQQTSPQIIG